jgi:glutamate dehydrogenase
VAIRIDARTRSLLKAVMEGVLSVPKDQLKGGAGIAELTKLFAQPDTVQKLMGAAPSEADEHAGLGAGFVQAWKAVDAIEGVAAFVFAALSVKRPAGMDLPGFLQVGIELRSQAGIDTLERGLKLPAVNKSQEALRSYAQQALRRTQQKLLSQVLSRATDGHNGLEAVELVTNTLGLSGYAPATDLEQAMLDVWALSEAVSATALAKAA